MVAYAKKVMSEADKIKLKANRIAGLNAARNSKKMDLINGIAKQTGLSKADTELTIKAMYNYVAYKMSRGQKVVMYGFGTFHVGKFAARNVRNPRTGDTIKIAARRAVRFKPSVKLNRFVI